MDQSQYQYHYSEIHMARPTAPTANIPAGVMCHGLFSPLYAELDAKINWRWLMCSFVKLTMGGVDPKEPWCERITLYLTYSDKEQWFYCNNQWVQWPFVNSCH